MTHSISAHNGDSDAAKEHNKMLKVYTNHALQSEVLKGSIFWDFTPCNPVKGSIFWDFTPCNPAEHIGSIFRAEYATQDTNTKAGGKQSFSHWYLVWLIRP
jgi:hypothetical protein